MLRVRPKLQTIVVFAEQAWSRHCFWQRTARISAPDFSDRDHHHPGCCSRFREAVSFIRSHETMLGSDEAIFIASRRRPETDA
jgi:hypothetical protein